MLNSFRRRAVIGLKHFVLVILAIALAGLWSSVVAAEKDAYRPYDRPTPQVIQAKDYPTIAAIEDLYAELKVLQDPPRWRDSVEVTWCIQGDLLVFQGPTGEKLTVKFTEDGPIEFADRLYAHEATIVAFSTLRRILADHQGDHPQGVWYSQWKNRIKQLLTRFEFMAGPKVINWVQHRMVRTVWKGFTSLTS